MSVSSLLLSKSHFLIQISKIEKSDAYILLSWKGQVSFGRPVQFRIALEILNGEGNQSRIIYV